MPAGSTWIDADTGAVLNEYDGLTTGSGVGVLGDTKDLSVRRNDAGAAWNVDLMINPGTSRYIYRDAAGVRDVVVGGYSVGLQLANTLRLTAGAAQALQQW